MNSARRQPLPRRHGARQRGGATLAVTLAIALVLSLLAATAHRALLAEQRMSANQHHGTIAFDAAEAGIDWMLARLNSGTSPGGSCDAAAPFRDRHAGIADNAGRWHPPAVSASCLLRAGAWQCECGSSPQHGDPTASTPPAGPRFSVRLEAEDPAHTMRIVSEGCANAAACGATRSAENGAAALVSVGIGHLPALAHAPAAALTVRDTLAPSARWTLVNREAGGTGLTLHTGGTAHLQNLALTSVPGTPPLASIAAADAALRSLAPSRLFASVFRLDKPSWQALPTVRRIACASPCDGALRQAVADGVRQFWLDGGLSLAEPGVLGSAAAPVLLVASGPVRLGARTTVFGVVYALSPEWHDSAGATVHGAVIAEGDLNGPGGTTVQRDPAVLSALQLATGTFTRVPGSWKDF